MDHIIIPAGPSDYARTGEVPARYPGQSVVGNGAGLSQGNVNKPPAFVHLAGQMTSVWRAGLVTIVVRRL